MSETTAPRPIIVKIAIFAPLVVFLGLVALFLVRLESGEDPSLVPSALVGGAAPETKLPPLEGVDLPGLDSASFKGEVTLVNVWASWCVPCREEHPMLEKLGEDKRFRLVGLNYKDQAENARRFLGGLGNPYAAIGVDPRGRAGIDWGVYGVPETFVVGRDGVIRYKFVGPLSEESLARVLMPEVEKALAAGS